MSMIRPRKSFRTFGSQRSKRSGFGSTRRLGSLTSLGSGSQSEVLSSDSLLEAPTNVRIGTFTVKGKDTMKPSNEDRISGCTPENDVLLTDTILTGFAGVYDGHGGAHCSSYIRERLFQRVTEAFTDEAAWEVGESLILEIFAAMDKEYLKIAKLMQETSGACATVVLVKDREVLVAHIGDCRAIRCDRNGKVVGYTTDHRAAHPVEKRRIMDAGERVMRGRVHSLEPSRTFGDLDVKSMVAENVIISTPEVIRLDFNNSPGEFLVVATDGLWEYVSQRSVAKIAKNALGRKEMKDPEKAAALAAENLVKYAQKKRSTDDISVAVLQF